MRMESGNLQICAGMAILLLIAIPAVGASYIFETNPLSIVGDPLIWPWQNRDHPLGTDLLGRDILVGLVYAARVSLLVGLSAATIGIVLGIPFGAAAGYFGGWTDFVVVRIVEFIQTIPNLIFAIVVVAMIGASLPVIILVLGILSAPAIVRLTRAEAMRLRSRDFVHAAKVIGMSEFRIVATHVIPNASAAAIASISILVAHGILMESALSFLGLGDPNTITWGSMIHMGRDALRSGWYMAAVPGLAICLTVVGLGILGNGLNDRFNPRHKAG